MKITISDVAREAGVSKSTVSKAMNGHPSIPDVTKRMIMATIDRLGFIPNTSAKNLASRSTRNLALLTDLSRERNFADPFFLNILSGIEGVAFKADFEVTLCNVNHLDSSSAFLARYVFSHRADGIFIPGSILSALIVEELHRRNFPHVIIGQPLEYAYSNWTDLDNGLGAEMLIDHIAAKGYTRPAFITGLESGPITRQRVEGFNRAVRRHGFKSDQHWLIHGQSDREHGLSTAGLLLDSPNPPDSFICEDNLVASGVYTAIRQRGLSIPKDLGVVSFNDYPLAPYMEPPLTVVDMDTYGLGETACLALIEQVENPERRQRATLIKPEIIERESTRRPGAAE